MPALPTLQERALLSPLRLPGPVGFLDRHALADLGDRDVPPRLVTRHTLQAVVLDVDHAGPVSHLRLRKGGHYLVVASALHHVRAQATRAGRQVQAELAGVRGVVAGQRTVDRVDV